MESIIQFIFEHAQHAHWIVFGALMLAGLNIPVSEDLMIIFSAVIAATVIPENTYKLFAAVFLGCYLSDWVCYWIGRHFGPKLWNISWFAKTFDKKKINTIEQYYEKYGFLTLLVGRLIPFGVRNCLFLTAGLGKMPFSRFILSDGIACIISNTALFTLAYTVGKNYEALISTLKTFNIFLFSAFLVAIISFIWYKRTKKAAT
ncbi:MAG: DedA family protein [Chlamydiae bacterium CG10_big_fil_rev_8_21_14_0_10_42_34]|nr:MAG: DedA family protein [Chlamydiae bacterium CG10_big_fil_rev_8_21_14_0_10_42_34]